jgi:translocation and assembly module TamA
MSLTYDGSNDLLDPTEGFRLGGRVSPELSLRGGTFGYTRAQLDASAYRPVSDRVVVAGRIRLGTIFGADRDDIAPSRRFYAGGGGSVRGYGYQRLGPRDVDGDPIGGRSLAEFALEARIRLKAFGGDFGIVPFFDGGTLSTRSTPKFGDWQFGAGLGVRYYTSFGPIRVDVGTPLNPQSDDGPVAVVVSLGQAF